MGKRSTPYRASLLALLTLLVAGTFASPASPASAQEAALDGSADTMEQLAGQRAALAVELEQVEATLAILHKGSGSPWDSDDDTVRALADKSVALKQAMLDLTERELELRKNLLRAPRATDNGDQSDSGTAYGAASGDEAVAVQRLRSLIAAYYADLQRSERDTTTPDELAARKAALAQSLALAKVQVDPQQLLLSGIEGNALLRRMNDYLSSDDALEFRRQTAPICSIRTRQLGSLVASENRSLQPVGRHLYVGEATIASGHTTLRVFNTEWQLETSTGGLPQHYLVTLKVLPETAPEMHLVRIDDLQHAPNAYIPDWLPSALLQQPVDE